MAEQEYATSPIVNVQSTIPSHPDISNRFSLRQLWPISEIYVKCARTPLSRLSIVLPAYAVSDVVAIFCKIEWRHLHEDLSSLIAEMDSKPMPHEECRAFHGIVDEYTVLPIINIITAVESAIKDFKEDSKGDWSIVTGHWLHGLSSMRQALKYWQGSWHDEEEVFDKGEVMSAAKMLETALSAPSAFSIPARIARDGSIGLSPLTSALRENGRSITIDSVLAPFTSEPEPGSLGKRSSLILFLLASVMFVAASVDLSWAAITSWLSWLPSPVSITDLREPLVALLLIFPAALYGQFFQARPNSVVGHRAQAGTFAALSTLFALPIFPAALLASGANVPIASAVSAAIGALSLLASVGVWTLFSESSLRRVRRRALNRRIQTEAQEVGA